MTYYITNPRNKERCVMILKALIGNHDLPEYGDGGVSVSADEVGVYFSDRAVLNGIEITEEPVIIEGAKVVHYRSKRVETVIGEALMKTEEGWKDCVIYGNDEGMTFVREKEDFMEAFAGIKE